MKKFCGKKSLQALVFSSALASLAMNLGGSALPLLLSALSIFPTQAEAADAPQPPADTIRPELIKILQPAQDLVKSQNYKDALDKLSAADAITDKTPYETYVTELLRFLSEDGIGNLDLGAASLNKLIATGRLPNADKAQNMRAYTSKFYEKKEYAKSIAWGTRYFKEGGNDPFVHRLLFSAYYNTDDVANAGKQMEILVQEEERAGRMPSEDDLTNLAAVYQDQKNTAGYVNMNERLAQLYPKKEAFGRLIDNMFKKPTYASYLDLDVYRLQQATDNLQKGDHYREYAKIALQEGYGIEAKVAYDAGVASGKIDPKTDGAKDKGLQDRIYKKAAEDLKALPTDEQSVTKSKDGTGLVHVGIMYLSNGQNDKAISLIEQGIAKGGLKHPEQAKLQLGMAYYMAGQKDKAAEVFNTVQGTDGTADLARIWLIKLGKI